MTHKPPKNTSSGKFPRLYMLLLFLHDVCVCVYFNNSIKYILEPSFRTVIIPLGKLFSPLLYSVNILGSITVSHFN